MRVWEFADKKETPSDLVLEQDFVMRVRHMQRSGPPCLVLNFILTGIPDLARDQKALDAVQKKLKAYAGTTRGSYFEMSNGDAFMVWENPGEARIVTTRTVEAVFDDPPADMTTFIVAYRLPENYVQLRERANAYVEGVRARAVASAMVEKVDDAAGRLTAHNVQQIERILIEADVRRYGRSQNIYRDAKGAWTQVGEEYFISFEDLRRENFPKLDIAGAGHFFFAVCAMLDQKLLTAITSSYGSVAGRTINLNLSIDSIMEAVFTQFVRSVPRDQRKLIGFELHCGDLFHDFGMSLSAIEILKREGFRVAIDGATPNMALYIDFDKFPVDRVKMKVDKDRVSQLIDPDIRKALGRISPDKLIFYRCDNERALAVGREMGVGIFQGWLIDDYATKAAKK